VKSEKKKGEGNDKFILIEILALSEDRFGSGKQQQGLIRLHG